MEHATVTALADVLAAHEHLVEIGIGRRTAVARRLAERGVAVTATDVVPRAVPDGVQFVRDDVTDPDPAVYAGADAIYACNLPPELHRPARDLARRLDVPLYFTTLGADQPAVPVRRRTLPGETLFVAEKSRRSGGTG